MGQSWSRLFRNDRKYRILMIGLDNSGKSSILYGLKLGEVVSTIPTIGFGMETVVRKQITLDSFSVGGRCHVRPLLKYFFQGTDAVVFTVNSQDVDMFEEARYELGFALEQESLVHCPVLILATKQDLTQANSVDMVTQALDLDSIKQDWAIFSTTIHEMDGVMRAFDWLNRRLEARDLKAACVTPVAETVSDLQDTITKTRRNLTDYFSIPLIKMKLWLS